MSQHLNLDTTSSTNPMAGGFGFQNIQTFVQLQLLNRFQTGNPMLDGLIATSMVSLLPMLFSRAEELLVGTKNYLWWMLGWLTRYLWLLVRNIYRYFTAQEQLKVIEKVAEIDYITDNKQINELYKAVHWYLSNSEEIDFLKESPLKFSFEKKITADTAKHLHHSSLNKFVTKNKAKEIEFNQHQISYTLTDHLINVYTDKERKRENYRITLKVEMDEKSNTDILEDFCNHCLAEYVRNLTSSTWVQQIYVNEGDKWKGSASKNRRKIDTVVLKDGLKEEIKKDLQMFMNSEEWYHHRDIPYTRGYLFYGLPGTGKTSMIKGISNLCKRHIHFLMLNQVKSDAQLLELFKNINYQETILVIEDIDCMTEIIQSRDLKEEIRRKLEEKEARKKKKEERRRRRKKEDRPAYKANEYGTQDETQASTEKLTLSGLLNALDGIFNNEGRILIMTTNHPEVLDSALIRPGRVDRKFLFDYCNRSQIQELYEMFFNSGCNKKQLTEVKERRYSPAHITSLFMRYRDHPEEALLHIDDDEDKPVIEPIVATPESEDSPTSEGYLDTESEDLSEANLVLEEITQSLDSEEQSDNDSENESENDSENESEPESEPESELEERPRVVISASA